MINLKAELRSADHNVGSLLASLANVSDKLSMLQDDTEAIRLRTSHLHAAKAGITTALTRMDNISTHFKTADLRSERLSSGFDAEALYQVADSVEFLKGQQQWLSSEATLRRLNDLQEKARATGLERLKRIWALSAPTIHRDVVGGAKLDAATVAEARAILECLLSTGDRTPLKAFGQERGKSLEAALVALCGENGTRDEFLRAASPHVPGSHPFTRLSGLALKLLQQEREYCQGLLNAPHHNSVFEAACEPCVALLHECGVRSAELVSGDESWQGVEGLGFTVLVDVAASFAGLHGELSSLCQPAGVRNGLSGTLKQLNDQLRFEALRSLAAVMEDVKTDASPIPQTATVSVLTSNTMRAVRRLCTLEPQYLQLVQAVSSYETASSGQSGGGGNLSAGSRGGLGAGSSVGNPLPGKLRVLVGSWSVDPLISLVVDELVAALEAKQDQTPPKSTTMAQCSLVAKRKLFVVNNLSYVIAGVTERASVDNQLGKKAAMLQKRHEGAVRDFCRTGWSDLLHHVAPISEGTLVFAKSKISFESGRVLKSRFDAFNLEFEEYLCALGSLSVPDAVLRQQLRENITGNFVPVCKQFFDKYSEITFSKKHQEQYLRNNPEVLQQKISGLFL